MEQLLKNFRDILETQGRINECQTKINDAHWQVNKASLILHAVQSVAIIYLIIKVWTLSN